MGVSHVETGSSGWQGPNTAYTPRCCGAVFLSKSECEIPKLLRVVDGALRRKMSGDWSTQGKTRAAKGAGPRVSHYIPKSWYFNSVCIVSPKEDLLSVKK